MIGRSPVAEKLLREQAKQVGHSMNFAITASSVLVSAHYANGLKTLPMALYAPQRVWVVIKSANMLYQVPMLRMTFDGRLHKNLF